MSAKRALSALALALVAAASFASAGAALSIDDAACPTVAGENTNTCPTGTVGVPYSITFKEREGSGCGPGKQTFHLDSGSLPPGLSLATNGTLSGTPTGAGKYEFYVEMREPTDDPEHCRGDKTQKRFTLPVGPGLAKLTIGPESTAPGTMGRPYSLQMTATVPEPKMWTLNAGTLPPGLALDASTGLISGTPVTAGSYSFEVLAKMVSDSRADTKTLGIVVRNPLAILGSDPFTETRRALSEVSVSFEATLVATGGSETYAWTTTGELPPGLLFTDGTISGTPTIAGVYAFTATVTDTEGRVASYPSRVVVVPKLAISTFVLKRGKVGKRYATKVATFGGLKPATWKAFRGRLPRGVRFNPTNGRLFGIPKKAGRYRITFQATDALGVVARKTLKIFVAPAPVRRKSR